MRTSRLRQWKTRGAVVAALAAAALTVTGCVSAPPGASPQSSASPSPSPRIDLTRVGGACLLLDADRLEQRLGVRFEVAGSARKTKTDTCVARPAAEAFPELSLSVTATKADVAVFKAVVRPDGAKSVSGLGRAGFRVISPQKKARPPSIEVGWLAGNARMLLLKVTMPDGSDEAAVNEMAKRLVEAAKDIDKQSI